MNCVVAIDAGTTGVRSFVVGDDGVPRGRAYREFPQHFPRPGWVEHDADDIWRVTVETLAEVARDVSDRGDTIAAINQRDIDNAADFERFIATKPRQLVFTVVRGEQAFFLRVQ